MRARTKGNENYTIPSETAIFASGCFWYLEESFQILDGVSNVYAGYTGGNMNNPTYQKVITNTTDHIGAVEVHYNPNVITYVELLQNFWRNFDPAESTIFYTSNEQKMLAEASRKELDDSKRFEEPNVTRIVAAKTFYKAENQHQNVYKKIRFASFLNKVWGIGNEK